jgi:3-isopropylmalate dehydrogenase
MNYNIGLIPGDGIGPEIVHAAIKVLDAVEAKFGHKFNYTKLLLGGASIDINGVPLTDEALLKAKTLDAVLLGAVGGPKWDTLPGHLRPEKGLLAIREGMGLYANIRPARLYPSLKDACPLRADIAAKGIDIIVVRELTGGIYFGPRGVNGEGAYDTEIYSEREVERVAKIAFKIASTRPRKKITSIDKANVLESSRLWRATVAKTAKNYPDIAVENMLVDNAAMQLVKNPSQFDVLLTPNMFGDILSDEAAMITGSIGILPSSSIGDSKRGLYEPIHGSAPDIAGKDIANPIATILSAAMMLESSLSLPSEAAAIRRAVADVLDAGYRTADLRADEAIGCKKMGLLIAEALKKSKKNKLKTC